MPHRPRIRINLPVIAALEGLVAEEMDCLVPDAGAALGGVGLGFDVAEAVRLVPAGGEDVEGDLPADGEATYKPRSEMGRDRSSKFGEGQRGC